MASSLLLEPQPWPSCLEAQPWHRSNASLQTRPSGDEQPGSQQTAAPPHPRPAPPPPPALSQLPARRPAVQGCQHCITCASLTTHAHTAGRAGSSTGHVAFEEWWPSGLPSPTIYLHLRRRQLHLQYRQAATPEGAAKLWRPLGEWRPCQLLAARGQQPLGLLIPLQCTNVQQSDGPAQLMAVKSVPRQTARQAAAAQPAGGAAAQALRRSQLRDEALAAAELLLCCGEELPLLPLRGGRVAGAAGRAAVQPAPAAASAAAAKREALTRSSSGSEQQPKRTRLEAAPVRRAAALHPAAQPPQACQQQQQERQQHRGAVQAQREGQEEDQAGPWWLRHPAAQQAAAATHARVPALPGRCLPATSPAPPSSLLATPGAAFPAAGCATGQATPLLSAGAGSCLLTAPSSGRGSLLLSTPELLPLARRASATAVFSITARSGESADLAARLPCSPFGGGAASAAASRQRHLLEVKAQHAFPCSEVVLQVGEEEAAAGPSILSAFLRLASRLAG